MAITPLVLSGTADYDIPSLVTIHPVAVASILDHHLRRPREADGKEQDRVIGTLMGTRSEAGHVNIASSFGVPFGQVDGKLLLDTDSLRQQLDIVVKAAPALGVVGWYATSPELNSWTPLIHDEYATLSRGSTPQFGGLGPLVSSAAPVHLTLDVNSLQIKTYAAAKLGLAPESSNRTFVPLSTEMKIAKTEQSGLEVLSKHSLPSMRPDNAASQSSNTQQLVAPLISLGGMLQEVNSMLDTVLTYVKSVNDGQQAGDARVGRYLLEALASVPVATSTKASFDEEFNTHLADLLMVSYLANVVRVNLEVAARASLLHDARLQPRSVSF